VQIAVIVAEIDRLNDENQKLKSMFKRMCCRYNQLQKYIRSMLQQQKEVDSSQVYHTVLEANLALALLGFVNLKDS